MKKKKKPPAHRPKLVRDGDVDGHWSTRASPLSPLERVKMD
jgi:hypothetical protein